MGDLDRVPDALRSLSREQRVAVIRAYYYGESLADIAMREDVSEDAVKIRLHQALHALRSALATSGGV